MNLLYLLVCLDMFALAGLVIISNSIYSLVAYLDMATTLYWIDQNLYFSSNKGISHFLDGFAEHVEGRSVVSKLCVLLYPRT